MRGKSGKAVCREIQARMGARFWNRRLNAYVWVVSVTEIHQEPTRGPQAKALSLSNFPDHNGLLVVTSENRVPLSVERVFTIHAGVGDRRGEHAHRTCTQFLVAVSGSWKIEVFRGSEASTFALDGPKSGVLIPPFLWAAQAATAPNSVLLVLCDKGFDEADYIRDRAIYLRTWREMVEGGAELDQDGAALRK